jgi:hypothetical protein
VSRISVSSALLLRATMSQKSFLPQVIQSVSEALMPDSVHFAEYRCLAVRE